MPYSKFNGVFKEIINQGINCDVVGLLQEKLQIPSDKAEELAKRIDYILEDAFVVDNNEKPEDLNPNPKMSSFAVESLSEKEFGRFMKGLLEELGFEIQVDQPVGVGVNVLTTKGGEMIFVHLINCPINLRIANLAVTKANELKQMHKCNRSIVVATGLFSHQAILDAQRLNVELWDRNTVVKKLEEVKNKTKFEEQSSFPPFKGSLLKSLLGLENTKDFIIEPKTYDKYDLYLPGIRHPLLTFQALGEEVVRCIFRIKYNEPVGEFDGEVLIRLDNNVRRGPDGLEAYAEVIQYLEQFLE
jgi:hypothetical protein